MTEGGSRTTSTEKKSPKVSIITVTLNAAAHFERFLTEIGPFLSEDVELIILDGESTDGTIDLINKFSDKIDYWRIEPDKGIYDAMNHAVKYAQGKWFYFLGIDDSLLPGFTPMVAALTEEKNIYYGNVMYYGEPLTRVYDDYFLTKLNIVHQAIFYPKTVFDKYKYTVSYVVYADYYLNLNLWKDSKYDFVHLDFLIATFPEGGYSSYTKDKLFERNRDQLFKRYLSPYAYYRYLNRTVGFWSMLIRMVTNG